MMPIPLWFYAVAAAVLLAVGGMEGAHLQGNHDDEVAAALADQVAHAAQVERARTDAVTAGADARAAAVIVANEQKNIELTKEVPHVVQSNPGRAGYVRAIGMLNDAAAGGVPVSEPAGPVDDTPAEAERVAAVVAGNIGQCRADLARFEQLQDWIEGIAEK